MSLFDKLLKRGELPEVRTVIEFDQKSTIELGVIIFITAACILLFNQMIKKGKQ